jgi:lipopolysaccharide transport system ATP-binding protein
MSAVISVEHLSKTYRLGQIGTGTLSRDLNVWWAKTRGKPNPLLRIDETDRGKRNGDELWALRDVSFTVEQGEVLGIIGRNGAGKSTLLKILSRVTAPTYGRIKVKGRIASLLEVGTGFHPELTGRENIYLNGAILGMSRKEIDRKFDEIVDFAEVEKFIDTPVKRYSSGMYVRLAFAVAAHLEPEILLVDEVLAVGDVAFQKKCLGKMGDVAKEGRTVLLVSHNMAAIENLCKQALLLNAGALICQGDRNVVISTYLIDNNSSSFIDLIQNDVIGNRLSIKYLHSLELEDTAQSPRRQFYIGETIVLKLRIIANSSVKTPHIGLGVNNSLGLRVFTLSTRHEGVQLPPITGNTEIICRMEDIKLSPGQYTFKITFGDLHSDFEVLESVKGFEIIPSDYFGSGKLPTSSQGVIVQTAKWDVENQ